MREKEVLWVGWGAERYCGWGGVGWGGGCPVGLQLRTRVQASGPQWEAGKGVWQLLRSHCSSLIDFDVRDVKQAFVLLL